MRIIAILESSLDLSLKTENGNIPYDPARHLCVYLKNLEPSIQNTVSSTIYNSIIYII